jgi:2,3-bisphosphoglycerate-dependent phosphoglycerate mutase
MATRITLIRHGETPWNADGRWQGQAPVPLNIEGRRQATMLGAYLARTNDPGDRIISSDLLRTRETAELIAAQIKVPVEYDPRLREIDLGMWQGLTKAEIIAWDKENWEMFHADNTNTRIPNGECWGDVAARVVTALREYAVRYDDEHILIVSHGGTIRRALEKLQTGDVTALAIGNTSYTRLICSSDDTPWTVDLLNSTEHLVVGEALAGGEQSEA